MTSTKNHFPHKIFRKYTKPLSILSKITQKTLQKAQTYSQDAVLGLDLLHVVDRLVDAGKASGASTTEMALEVVADDDVGGNLVHLRQTVTNFVLWDGRTRRVEDFDDLEKNYVIHDEKKV